MAEPVEWAGIIALAGAAASAAGSYVAGQGAKYEGDARANMMRYQAGVARVNQQIAEQNASYQRYVGEVEAQQEGMKTRFEMGNAKAAQAASGLDVNTGTAADVRESIHEVGLQDEATIRANAARKAYSSEIEAWAKGTDADLLGMGADVAGKTGQIGEITSYLGGASSVADKWLKASQYYGGGGDSYDPGNRWVQAGQGQGPWAAS